MSKVESSWFKWFKVNTFTANNTLICLLTTLFFITALLLFFWYIISDQFKIILLDKLDIVKLYIGYNKDAKEEVIAKINKFNLDPENQKKLIEEREKNNIKLFIDKMLWWFIVLITMILLNIVYIVFYKVEFSKPDLMLVIFVLSAFVAEIIFYVVVIKEWKFIGDNEIMKEIMY
jgi:hypothetical protein